MRLIVRNLKKNIENKTILENVSYSFSNGVVYGLVGNKGCGKTTFIRCISGECKIDGGYIKIEADWKEYGIKYSDFGIVSEECTVPEYVTGDELFDSIKSIHPEYIEEGKDINYYLEKVGLSSKMKDKLIKDYSEIDKKKIQMMAILMMKPSIIIFDEPYKKSGKNKYKELKNFIKEIRDRVVIVATDDISVAEELCDEIVQLENGKLLMNPIEEIRKQMRNSEEESNA